MLAYYVHDDKKGQDFMIVPELDATVSVDRQIMTDFISVSPDFSQWTGAALNGLNPETFGRVVATRDDQGDVCIMDTDFWQQRMASYLGSS